jgi:hypothetical protein
MSTRIAVITASILLSAASTASAASLAVSVSPSTVRSGKTYKVTVSGRYGGRRRRTPYLLVFIQYSGAACRHSGTAEYALPARYWSWDIYPRPELHSPFKHTQYWKATGRLGARRVCAYLYSQKISSVSTLRPLARASAEFRATRR